MRKLTPKNDFGKASPDGIEDENHRQRHAGLQRRESQNVDSLPKTYQLEDSTADKVVGQPSSDTDKPMQIGNSQSASRHPSKRIVRLSANQQHAHSDRVVNHQTRQENNVRIEARLEDNGRVHSNNATVSESKALRGKTERPKDETVVHRSLKDMEKDRMKGREPSDEDRVAFLNRLEQGDAVNRYTKSGYVFKSPLLPPNDVWMIARKLRRRNMVPNILIWICLAIMMLCLLGIAVHMHDLAQRDDELQSVARTYTTTRSEGDDISLPPAVDFAALRAINPEVSGWIYIPGTNVNYPILSSEIREKYLRMDLYGNSTIPGSIFTDWANAADYSDEHIIIYGHHLPSDTMFTPVTRYLDEPEFIDEHSTIYVETPDVTYRLAAIGAYKVDPNEGETVQVGFSDTANFQRYLDQRLAKCTVKLQNQPTRETMDKLFTLVTCTDSGQARAIVECVPVEVYPTSYIESIRAKAGAAVTTVSVSQEDIDAQKAKAEEAQSGDSFDLLQWLSDFSYRITTWLDGTDASDIQTAESVQTDEDAVDVTAEPADNQANDS